MTAVGWLTGKGLKGKCLLLVIKDILPVLVL